MNVLLAKEVAERRQIVVKQRFAAGEDDLTNAKFLQRRAVALHIVRMNLIVRFTFPDVAHDAATVTATVNVQDEDRKRRESGWNR
jgi:hypothetical protein